MFEESPDTGLRLDEIMSGAWSQAELVDALQEIADGVYGVVGFGVAAISVLRDNDELEIVAVSGNADAREELLGKRRALSTLEADIAMADWWGPLCFVPEERVVDRLEDPGWVPDVTPVDDANAWKPLDFLFSPLRDDVGDPVGVLAVDLPADGLRPDEDRQRLLQRYAEYSAKAVNALLARERLTERLRLAETARSIVRTACAQLNLDRILADCQGAIVEGFGAHGLWIQTFDDLDGQDHGVVFSSGGGEPVALEDGMIEIAQAAARSLWDAQRVTIMTRRRPPSSHDPLTEAERNTIAGLPRRDRPRLDAVRAVGRRARVPRLPRADPHRGRPRVDPGRGRRGPRHRPRPRPGGPRTPASSSARRSCSTRCVSSTATSRS